METVLEERVEDAAIIATDMFIKNASDIALLTRGIAKIMSPTLYAKALHYDALELTREEGYLSSMSPEDIDKFNLTSYDVVLRKCGFKSEQIKELMQEYQSQL